MSKPDSTARVTPAPKTNVADYWPEEPAPDLTGSPEDVAAALGIDMDTFVNIVTARDINGVQKAYLAAMAKFPPSVQGQAAQALQDPVSLDLEVAAEAKRLKVKADGRKRFLTESSAYGLFDPASTLTPAEVQEDDDADYLIEGLIERETVTMLAADSYVGKSYLALDWGLCVASGAMWHGRDVAQTRVLYLQMEGAKTMKARIGAWTAARGVTPSSDFEVYNKVVNFMDEDSVTTLADYVKAADIGLVVIDTLSRAIGGANESAAEDMGAFVAAVSRVREAGTHTSVLVLHHTKKDEPREYRGSTVLFAAMDTVWVLAREDKTTPFRSLENQKFKSGTLQNSLSLVFEPVAGSAVLERSSLGVGDKTLHALAQLEKEMSTVRRSDLTEALVSAGTYSNLTSAGNRISALTKEGKIEAYGPRLSSIRLP